MLKRIILILFLFWTFLSCSCIKKDNNQHQEEILNKKNIDKRGKTYRNLNIKLFQAIKEGKIKRIKRLISKGADVNARNEHTITVLNLAVSWGKYDITKYLIKKGAKVNKANITGIITPLHSASNSTSDPKFAKLLIKHGANLEAKDFIDETPLFYAVKSENINLVKYLVSKGANVNAKNDKGESALMHAAQRGYLDIVKILVENGANVNAVNNVDSSVKQDGSGYSSVMAYAMIGISGKGNPKIIKYLRSKGAKRFKELRKIRKRR